MGEEVQATIQQLWSEISKLHGTGTNHIKGKTDQRRQRVLKHELLIVHKAKFMSRQLFNTIVTMYENFIHLPFSLLGYKSHLSSFLLTLDIYL